MPIRVISDIRPSNDADFPVVDIIYTKGGYYSVTDIASRDAITTERRSVGMLVHVRSTNRNYRLVGGTANVNWQLDAANLAYEHTQGVTASSWVIVHNLGYNPSVLIMDANGVNVIGTIAYPSGGTVATATFNKTLTGSGFCS